MSFLNPSGLWLLLGIPLLIFLYIIKQKYVNRNLGSSFIWMKSEPFIKKNIKLRKLLRYLLIALQILIIAFSAFVLARPVSSEQAVMTKHIVILDTSGSMQAESETGESRFLKAAQKISDLASDMVNGSTMSIICTGSSASFVVKNTQSESIVRRALDTLECDWSESDISGAIALAMREKSDTVETNIILYTDTDYIEAGDIQVVNMAGKETNAAVLSLTDKMVKNDGYTFTGTVASYGKSDTLTVGLYIDGVLKDAKLVDCEEGVTTEVIFEQIDIDTYSQARLTIEAEDSIANDNEYILVNENNVKKNILIVSNSPLFIEVALKVSGDFNIKTTKKLEEIPLPTAETKGTEEKYGDLTGYDLYIFDGIIPETLPDDGTIWLINPDTLPDGTGLVIGDEVNSEDGESNVKLLVDNTSKTYTTLAKNLNVEKIAISKYIQFTEFSGYETIFACNSSPLLLAKESEDYKKTLVLTFDIHNSNLPLLSAFPLLISNMVEYSIPSMLSERDYEVNDSVSITTLPGAVSIEISSDSISETQLSLYVDENTYTPTKTGLYTIRQTISGSVLEDNTDAFFVHMNLVESNIQPDVASLGLGESTQEIEQQEDSFLSSIYSAFSKVWPLVIVLLLFILISEWGLYYHEQY